MTAPAGGGGVPIPPLNLSAGPAVAEAGSSGGQSTTGDFNFGPHSGGGWSGLVLQIAPLLVLGGVVWAMTRR